MNGKAQIELTIRYGSYGEKSKTFAVQISGDLSRELMEGVELSDDPISLLCSSPAFFGGRGDSVTIRRKTFKMRREVAKAISAAMVPELMRAFGVNDQLDGYKVDELSDEEREWHRRRGRL